MGDKTSAVTTSTVSRSAEQAAGQEQVTGDGNEKGLTNLNREWGNGVNDTGEDHLQTLGVLGGDVDAAHCNIGGDGWDLDRGWGCRAEQAEGEGGEDREGERTHYEWLMSVGKESDWVW